MLLVNLVLIKKILTCLDVIKLVEGHGGLSPRFTLNRFQKLLENQNVHHFEISRIHRDGAVDGKVTLTKQSKSRQSQRKAVDQGEGAGKSAMALALGKVAKRRNTKAQPQRYDDQQHINQAKERQKTVTNEA